MSKTVVIPFNNWIVKYDPREKKPFMGIVNWHNDELSYIDQDHKSFMTAKEAFDWVEEKRLNS